MASFMDPLLGWLLYFHPALGLLIVSLLISVITTLAIKFLTNQSLMKDLRNELKELQKEMKDLRNNPKKMAQVNERMMETNSKYMSHSMRPTFFTLIPILLIFGWLSSHIGYYPIMPGENFQITAVFEEGVNGEVNINLPEEIKLLEGEPNREILRKEVSWILLSDNEGDYNIEFEVNGKTYTKRVLITNEREYAPIETSFRKRFLFFSSKEENGFNSIKLSNKEVKPFEDVPVLKDLPLISGFNWFWTYFVFSIAFSMGLRRLLNLY